MGGRSVKTRTIIALSVAAGIAIGAAAVQTLHAQAKPPGFVVVEIDVSNPDAYAKEFLPGAGKALTDGGIKFLARGGKSIGIEGEPPKSRLVIAQFESLEKANAAYTSPAYMEARKIGNQYAKFRIWAIEGVAQ
jgi:uncharacterized protein (DUF1330 family)